MKGQRNRYSAEEKVGILKRHLVEKVAVSDLCDEYGLNPNVFYRWQKEFFENGAAAFDKKRKGSTPSSKERRKITRLKEKLAYKDEVIAEIMADHVRLKKVLGRTEGQLGGDRYPGSGGGLCALLVHSDGVVGTAPWAMSRRRICWRAARQRFLPNGSVSSSRRVSNA
jgi:transposase